MVDAYSGQWFHIALNDGQTAIVYELTVHLDDGLLSHCNLWSQFLLRLLCEVYRIVSIVMFAELALVQS